MRSSCKVATRKTLFDLLRSAYVDARYNKTYQITDEELDTLGERVQKLKEIAAKVCGERIEELQPVVNGNSEHSG